MDKTKNYPDTSWSAYNDDLDFFYEEDPAQQPEEDTVQKAETEKPETKSIKHEDISVTEQQAEEANASWMDTDGLYGRSSLYFQDSYDLPDLDDLYFSPPQAKEAEAAGIAIDSVRNEESGMKNSVLQEDATEDPMAIQTEEPENLPEKMTSVQSMTESDPLTEDFFEEASPAVREETEEIHIPNESVSLQAAEESRETVMLTLEQEEEQNKREIIQSLMEDSAPADPEDEYADASFFESNPEADAFMGELAQIRISEPSAASGKAEPEQISAPLQAAENLPASNISESEDEEDEEEESQFRTLIVYMLATLVVLGVILIGVYKYIIVFVFAICLAVTVWFTISDRREKARRLAEGAESPADGLESLTELSAAESVKSL